MPRTSVHLGRALRGNLERGPGRYTARYCRSETVHVALSRQGNDRNLHRVVEQCSAAKDGIVSNGARRVFLGGNLVDPVSPTRSLALVRPRRLSLLW